MVQYLVDMNAKVWKFQSHHLLYELSKIKELTVTQRNELNVKVHGAKNVL